MSTLQSRVDMRFPVAVVVLAGSLDAQSTAAADSILWDCLAEMPTAMIIECSELIYDVDGWRWLGELHQRAGDWPGAEVALAGGRSTAQEKLLIPSFASVDSALAARSALIPGERRQAALPPHPDSCARARELVAQACQEWGLRRPKRLAELLISELVGNGVTHARTELMVTVRLRDGSLELSVRDLSPRVLPPPQADPRGFGLQLVGQLSDSWGWAAVGHGKVVWSRLAAID
ncbi:hypothetical protein Rhe02_66140 [Rhizocola hellebori]|uniref:Histidine kinase/HSP90-like ATPase domain-containing protein n=1 Tax=Rhizocola hellebori TaxID=1392758 RepID=A0A8J3VJK1_9ACTN|nr:ATP-binding protein [Rhizocola hellebori]GIH08547.1 hypothetical protein Rhe02_66140 [Rhizocola hellebori]